MYLLIEGHFKGLDTLIIRPLSRNAVPGWLRTLRDFTAKEQRS
jgi:hypothetical protein